MLKKLPSHIKLFFTRSLAVLRAFFAKLLTIRLSTEHLTSPSEMLLLHFLTD